MESQYILLEPHLPELAHLGFHRYVPHLHLRPWIQCYWTAQQKYLPNNGFTETLYPDGGTSLTFFFNNNQLPDIAFKANPTASKIHFQYSIDCLGVRFNPSGAFKLLGIDMNSAHYDDQVAFLLDQSIHDLQQQLANVHNTRSRLTLIENWLLNKLLQRNPEQGLLQHFVPTFLKSDTSFEELIKTESISRRQLERKFQQEIGLSPAQFKQLHRIKKARQLISIDPRTSLTNIALDCGFYDQAHFIRQFQKVTGQTPGQYKNRKMSQKYNR